MTLGDRIVVMARGAIQQVGTPMDVYRAPANRFVAGFVGSPPMNFIEGRIERGRFIGPDGLSIALPRDLARAADRPCTLGIRPQALSIASTGLAFPSLAFRVDVVEPLGDAIDLIGTAHGCRLVARIPASPRAETTHSASTTMTPGTTITLHPDPDQLHLFEPGEFGRCFA